MTYDGAERVSAAELERALAGHPLDCGCSGCAFRNDLPPAHFTDGGEVTVGGAPHYRVTPRIVGEANVREFKERLGVCPAPGCRKIARHDSPCTPRSSP